MPRNQSTSSSYPADSESETDLKDARKQARKVSHTLAKTYPDADCALIHRNPFELTVATILSAQCTDKMVNKVTPALFARYPGPQAMAAADPKELEDLIHPTGFFRAKAKNLIGMSQGLVERFDGQVPRRLEDLTSLPGVGRKTAHVVLGVAFGIPSGVVVDTHVKRLAYRLGLTDAHDPERVERDLVRALPRSHWIAFSHRMITLGREVCGSARPQCERCPLTKICPKRLD
ncbi:MAG TPA: endonuclease III [Isosphaeraceae bacterium]|nr:endonuclease III [Isosphaeraceae bacterium]